MGLDMYLHRKIYVWNQMRGGLKISGLTATIHPKKVCYIVEEAGYWRKANAIHQWFVKNVQDGKDDCGHYYVSKEKLQELLDTVNKVLRDTKLVDGKVTNGYKIEGGKNGEPIKEIPNLEDGKVVVDSAVAEQLLPTTAGFFFGSTHYDQWYVQDLKDTRKILRAALKDEDAEYEYHSSW